MGPFDRDVETQYLCHFAWCIARLVAPVQKLVQHILFLQVDKLSGGSLQKKIILILVHFLFSQIIVQNRLSLSVGLEIGEGGCIKA